MSITTVIDRALVRFTRNPGTSDRLRQRFQAKHDMHVGRHTIGGFDRWRLSRGTRIGRYCSIASTARIIDANHPVEALSTSPGFYLKSMGLVDKDMVHAEPTVIEDDVWLGHFAIVTPGCKKVGRGAVVGSGAVVMRDVPPYAIMVGSPAQVARYRFPRSVVEAVEATRWWELEPDELAIASRADPEFLTKPTVEGAQAFLRALGRPEFIPSCTGATFNLDLNEAELIAAVQEEDSSFAPADLDKPLNDLAIDSFGLISLRISLEQTSGKRISDTDWSTIVTLRDILSVSGSSEKSPSYSVKKLHSGISASSEAISQKDDAQRHYLINMPQMAMSGLSESWMFKEVGDLHWSNICRGLATTSSKICDDNGERLYATFTRFRTRASADLTKFKENAPLSLSLTTTRLGAGMFFGNGQAVSSDMIVNVEVMTSFAKFGEHGGNSSLLKGQPQIPENCTIAALSEQPVFAREYRALRATEHAVPIFTTEYDMLPPHDINGVGLLYFAAYPTIADLCAMRFNDRAFAAGLSTIERDVCYFANANPSERLVYRLLRWEEQDETILIEATLSRKSDDVVMALVRTLKTKLG